MTNTIHFLKEGLKNLRTVGTLTRSSKYLCQLIVDQIDFQQAQVIIELGAGDGVITKFILRNMKPDARLFVFELNDKFCRQLRDIHDERLVVIEESAEFQQEFLRSHGYDKVDFVVSAIPFVVLPNALARKIVTTSKTLLKSGGQFIQVHYSLALKNFYNEMFGNVAVKWEPLNVPPAFILTCEKR
jgi:phospholipid N-methyltransferase